MTPNILSNGHKTISGKIFQNFEKLFEYGYHFQILNVIFSCEIVTFCKASSSLISYDEFGNSNTSHDNISY